MYAECLLLSIILGSILRMSIRHSLLALLSSGPKYGLQLGQEFEDSTGEVWPLNSGQVYTTLQRLERDGLVASAGSDGPQKAFEITESGRADLDSWLRTPPDMGSPPRDELLIKLLVALRVPDADITGLIQAHRRHVIQAMHNFTRVKENASEHEVELLLIADAELFRLDGVARWLDAAESRIQQQGDPRNTRPSQQRSPRRARVTS